MKFENIISDSERIAPNPEFSEAYALISTAKSWRKWSKTVSRPFYERICEEAREAVAAFGLDESDADRFIRNVIDHYIDHGILNPDSDILSWELGLFALFRRRIDEAIRRRYRAMLTARRRKTTRSASVPDHSLPPAGRDARPARPQSPTTLAAPQPAMTRKSTAHKPLPGGKIGRKWRREARKACKTDKRKSEHRLTSVSLSFKTSKSGGV